MENEKLRRAGLGESLWGRIFGMRRYENVDERGSCGDFKNFSKSRAKAFGRAIQLQKEIRQILAEAKFQMFLPETSRTTSSLQIHTRRAAHKTGAFLSTPVLRNRKVQSLQKRLP
jgi:hypothetical protein